jgi:hypothetical protein
MDDFLHNLRSGKLKQPDRQNRQYGDQQYKGGPRRNMTDRRKRDTDGKESYDRMPAIKEVLENLVETQKRMATVYQERTKVEERKANAMEMIAKHLFRMLNPNADEPETVLENAAPLEPAPEMMQESRSDSRDIDSEIETAEQVNTTEMSVAEESLEADPHEIATEETAVAPSALDDDTERHATGRLTEVDRHTLFSVINQMRSEGNNWESIARHIATKGYPTVSGKGVWRGVMVKNLYEKMAA